MHLELLAEAFFFVFDIFLDHNINAGGNVEESGRGFRNVADGTCSVDGDFFGFSRKMLVFNVL